jgi:hypothetical protein
MKNYNINLPKIEKSLKWGLCLAIGSLLIGLYFHSVGGDEGLFFFFLNLVIILPLHLIGLFLIGKNIKNLPFRLLILVYAFLAIYFILYPLLGF